MFFYEGKSHTRELESLSESIYYKYIYNISIPIEEIGTVVLPDAVNITIIIKSYDRVINYIELIGPKLILACTNISIEILNPVNKWASLYALYPVDYAVINNNIMFIFNVCNYVLNVPLYVRHLMFKNINSNSPLNKMGKISVLYLDYTNRCVSISVNYAISLQKIFLTGVNRTVIQKMPYKCKVIRRMPIYY